MNESRLSNFSIIITLVVIPINLVLGDLFSIQDTDFKYDNADDKHKHEHVTTLSKEEQHKLIDFCLREYNSKWCDNCTNRFDMFLLFRITDQILPYGTMRRIYIELGETYCPKDVTAPDCEFKPGFGWNNHLICILEVREDFNSNTMDNFKKEFKPKCMPKTLRLLRMFIDIAHVIHAESFWV